LSNIKIANHTITIFANSIQFIKLDSLFPKSLNGPSNYSKIKGTLFIKPG